MLTKYQLIQLNPNGLRPLDVIIEDERGMSQWLYIMYPGHKAQYMTYPANRDILKEMAIIRANGAYILSRGQLKEVR